MFTRAHLLAAIRRSDAPRMGILALERLWELDAALNGDGPPIEDDPPPRMRQGKGALAYRIRGITLAAIDDAIREADGNIAQAARALGCSRYTIYRWKRRGEA